ncbi:hypothetical protein HanXRQr2_Chr11g0478111 [Helianthus annuus]|uniref:Uncharacterized protein n=1 Tax=Helianthus annuus TaxID=4232 RepID=A0A9K3HM28_HELAN|nr:hypothetical protein HanXRQr2_Chr11g0478111 [Helianthus annuus]KAJ0874157.1 hypothetical protein HanPSC8_Chr11g0460831 [Helianthus annuus]
MTGMSNSLTGFSSALSAVTGMICIVFLHAQTELNQHGFVTFIVNYKVARI